MAIPVFDNLLIVWRVRHRFRATFSRQTRQVRKEATVTGSFVCSGRRCLAFFIGPSCHLRVARFHDNLGSLIMTKRLYYDQPDLLEFDSVVEEAAGSSSEAPRPAVVLRESAFYPTSGGQVHDTGWITLGENDRLRVVGIA